MSFRRKVIIGVLAVVAALSLVAVAVWVNSAKGRQAAEGGLAGGPQKVTFADGAKTGNAELDAFVRGFVELCLKGDYDTFRLCWTAHAPQISSSRFRSMWEAAETIMITEISPLPGKAKGKAYLVKASASVSPKVKAKVQHKDVEVLVVREDGKWVVAPAPHTDTEDKGATSMPTGTNSPTTTAASEQ